jgi:hypothetical protein
MDGRAIIHRLNVFEPYLVLEAHTTLVGAKTVDGFIAGYGDGPCHWFTPGGIVHRGFLPKHEHDFLSDIFGICFVVEDTISRGVNDTDVPVVKNGKCLRVAYPHALDQFNVANF